VPWPQVQQDAALIQYRRLRSVRHRPHILKGHWPKPLPWPFTLGHELWRRHRRAGREFSEDFMGKPLGVGSK